MNKTTKWYARPLYAVMVLALVAGLTLVPVASPIVEASSVSNVTAALSNPTNGTASNYTINFTTNVKLTTAASDTITVEFPSGTTSNTTISGLTTSYVTVNGTAPSSVSTGGRRVSVTPGADVNAGNVTVVFSGNKITNPAPEGSYTLKVYTTQEPTAVTSSSYIVDTTPTVCNVTNTPTRVNTTALYHLNATVPTQLLQGDTITITFPATTTVPTSITSTSYVDINGTNLDSTLDYSVSNKTVTLSAPATVNAGFMLVNFTTGVGLKNPTSIRSNWTVKIYTSKDRGVKRSDTYSTTAGNESVITQTVWSSYDAYLPNNTCSSAFKIRTLDVNGANATVTGDVTFNLDGDTGGKFYDSTDCDNQIITTTIAGDASQSDAFYYKNTQPGTRDVTAVDVNGTWTQASQSIIVNPMLQLWGGGAKAASYSTFGEAIAAALPYDTIKVAPSTYQENFTVNTTHLTIESTAGKANTTLKGGIRLMHQSLANNFTLGGAPGKGFTLDGWNKDGSGPTYIMWLLAGGRTQPGPSNVTVSYNTFNTTPAVNASMAIVMDTCNITGLTVTENAFIIGDLYDQGVRGVPSSNVSALTVTNNTFTNTNPLFDNSAVEMNRLIMNYTNTIITGNTFTTMGNGIMIGESWGVSGLDSNNTAGRLYINNNTFDGCLYGIRLYNALAGGQRQNITMNTNNFTNNTYAISIGKVKAADLLQPNNYTVRQNNFDNNTYAVYNGALTSGGYLPATINWWGSADGPSSNASGSGDKITINITYSPWLNEPYPGSNTTAFSNITLQVNWNFISVPRKLSNATFGFLLSGINFSTAWGYNASTATWVNLTSSSAVEVLSGYWIDSNEAATINLTFVSTGQEVPASKNLTGNKWNAIGFSNLTAVPANATLKSVEGSWSTVLGWDATDQCYDDSIIYEMNDNTTMNPGKGYWLWMTANDTLAALSA